MENSQVSHALGGLTEAVNGLRRDMQEFKDQRANLSKRVASLEHSRSKLLGTVSGISAIVGVAGSWLATNLLPRIPH